MGGARKYLCLPIKKSEHHKTKWAENYLGRKGPADISLT